MTDRHDLAHQLNELDPGLLSRLALEASSLFERSRESAGTAAESGQIQAEVRSVRKAMVDLIDRTGCCPTEIVGALGALRDPDLIPLFRRCLSWQIGRQDAGGVYAAMIALDRLGEDVFAGRHGRSIIEWDLNRSLALAYLDRIPDLER